MGKWKITGEAKQRINEQIRVSSVRVIAADGTQLGVMPTDKAMEQARLADLDLVEVVPNERPPVCRIMDFGKFKYQQKKRQHKSHSHQMKIKEIRVRPKTGDHDLNVKVGKAREFLEHKDKVIVKRDVPRPRVGPHRRRSQGDRRYPHQIGRRFQGRIPSNASRPANDLHAGAEIKSRHGMA